MVRGCRRTVRVTREVGRREPVPPRKFNSVSAVATYANGSESPVAGVTWGQGSWLADGRDEVQLEIVDLVIDFPCDQGVASVRYEVIYGVGAPFYFTIAADGAAVPVSQSGWTWTSYDRQDGTCWIAKNTFTVVCPSCDPDGYPPGVTPEYVGDSPAFDGFSYSDVSVDTDPPYTRTIEVTVNFTPIIPGEDLGAVSVAAACRCTSGGGVFLIPQPPGA